jgi:hypothetical protein
MREVGLSISRLAVLSVALVVTPWFHCTVGKYKVTPNASQWIQGPVPKGARVYPDAVWHRAEGGDLPGVVWFRLAHDQQHGWICTELLIDATRPLTTSALRAVPLSRLIEQLVTQPLTMEDYAGGEIIDGIPDYYDMTLADLPDADVRQIVMSNSKRPVKMRAKSRRGGSGPTPDELRRFAEAYRWALVHQGHRPVAAAAERMSIGRATAHRWLKLVRESEGEGSDR